MSSVNTICTSTGLGGGQGFLQGDHTVPADCEVRELKSCENCGRAFMRKVTTHHAIEIVNQHVDGTSYLCEGDPLKKIIYRDTGERYCGPCKSTQLAPPDVGEYKDMLPTSAEMMHRTYIPASEPVRRPNRRNPHLTGWRERLMRAFAERGPLSSVEIVEVTHYNTGDAHASKVLTFIRISGIELVVVGTVWPSKVRRSSLFFPKQMIAPYYQAKPATEAFTDEFVTRKLAEYREMQAKGEI